MKSDPDTMRRVARLGHGEMAWSIGDRYIDPVHGSVEVKRVLGFCDDLQLVGSDLRTTKTWRMDVVPVGKKRSIKAVYQVPDRDLADRILAKLDAGTKAPPPVGEE